VTIFHKLNKFEQPGGGEAQHLLHHRVQEPRPQGRSDDEPEQQDAQGRRGMPAEE
jgi:hypothetical protein